MLTICYISIRLIENFVTDFSAPMRARVFKFCIHLHRVELESVKEKQDTVNFAIFTPFRFPSVTHVQDIGKFVSKISQELLHLGF